MMTWCEPSAVYAALSSQPGSPRRQLRAVPLGQHDLRIRPAPAGYQDPPPAGLLRAIYAIAVESNISIDAVHRSGERITLADFLSRPELHDSDVTAAWRTAHPDRVSDIMSLSAFLVCSLQLGD